jgi:ATP-binding cassette, subfamily F, member 3
MVERVADRLWLVKDGAVSDFEGDLEDYRKFTIQARREERKEEKNRKDKAERAVQKPAPEKRQNVTVLKKKAEEAEKAVTRLTREKEKLEAQMAEPGFFADGKRAAETQRAYDQVLKDLEAQETAWLEAAQAIA